MTTKEIMKVTPAMKAAKMEPHMPEPSATRKAMKARPVTIGCRIMTRVSTFVESLEAVLKVVSSIADMIAVGS